jgi:long-chain acyl-CoA synthetase
MEKNMSDARPDNLVDLFETAARRYSANPFIGTRGPYGAYTYVTYGEVKKRVDDVRAGLASLGVSTRDAVGFIGKNSVEWAVGAFATFGLRARWVPMYEAELEAVRCYIIRDASIKVLFVATSEIYDQVIGLVKEIPTLQSVVLLKGESDHSLSALERRGRDKPVAPAFPTTEEVATIIYTSGTTGDPKGVLLSHRNLTSNALDGGGMVSDLDESCRSLSILPWAHAYGLTAELLNFTHIGGSIGIAESVATIADDIRRVHPTHLIAVPRVFNRIYNGIRTTVETKGGLPAKLFHWGITNAAKKREFAEKGQSSHLLSLQVAIADKVVFKKIRARFGGRLRVAVTGSATMNEEIARFFYDIGVTTLDCYGLTETSPAVTMNVLESVKFGTVGKAIPGVRLEIDKTKGDVNSDDGEVIVYGPNVMLGYHNKPEATAAVMTPDGGFRTGDLGRLDKDGYLRITGRIKEQFKLSNGKYVFPAAIEEELKLRPELANALIFGEGRDFNICLVVPDYEYLKRWAEGKGLPQTREALATSPQLKDHLEHKIAGALEGKFGGYEIPKKVLILAEDFSTENGMLTQTLKLKRRVVLERYMPQIDALYA